MKTCMLFVLGRRQSSQANLPFQAFTLVEDKTAKPIYRSKLLFHTLVQQTAV
jgi:hypothetical protein